MYYYVIRYVVPSYLIVLLIGWLWQSLDEAILLKGVPSQQHVYIWISRATMFSVVVAAMLLVAFAGRVRAGDSIAGTNDKGKEA